MTSLGIALVTAAVQVTLAALIAIAVVMWAGRRSPRAAAGLAAAGLGLCSLLSLAAVGPVPGWWTWEATHPHAAQGPNVLEPVEAPAPSPAGGFVFPLRRLAALLPAAGFVPPEREPTGGIWPVLAVTFIAGVGFEGFRVAAGLFAVAALRRRSVPIRDPNLIAEVDELRRSLGVSAAVAVRQAAGVGTAATLGSWRPIVLFASDWLTWSPTERRAVLAHELAHVRRRDYLVGLLAAVGRAVHFYHPLVRRLASRLRLQQELAADALAATVAGGRAAYRRSLAGMALRQDAALVAGVARPFLSDRSSLLRRMAMLRVTDDERPLSRAVRWSLAVLLVAVAVGASAVRGTAQGPPAAAPPAGELPPFDLSLVPAKADGVVLIRPAALLGRPEMKPLADCWNGLLAAYFREWGFGPDFTFSLAEIEQAVGPFELKTLSAAERKQNPNGEGHAVVMGLTAIRMMPGFDWPAKLKSLPPALGVKEVKPGVYELRVPNLGPNPQTLHVPDARTLVLTESGQAPSSPDDSAARWGATGRHVQRAGLAVLLDNRRGLWTGSMSSDPAALAAAIGKPILVTYGLNWGERVSVTVAAEYAEAPKGADVERRVAALRELAGAALAAHKPADATEQWLHDLIGELLRTAAVRQDGKLVAVDATSPRRWVDVLAAIPVDGPAKAKSVEVKDEKR
jgi:BlaR1 peptidase M56